MSDLNVNIDSLIGMAKDYVKRAGIDEDNSGTINTNRELERLLMGTGAGSIEDLTTESIHEKILQNNTEKVFESFVANENEEQLQANLSKMEEGIENLSDFYDYLGNHFDHIQTRILDARELVSNLMSDMNKIKKEYSAGESGLSTGLAEPERIIAEMEDLFACFHQIREGCQEIASSYEEFTGTEFQLMNDEVHQLERVGIILTSQIKAIKDKSVPDNTNLIDEIQNVELKLHDSIIEIDQLKKQYSGKLREDDIGIMTRVHDLLETLANIDANGIEIKLPSGGSAKINPLDTSIRREEVAKQLLYGLIDGLSPIARNYLIKMAEEANESGKGGETEVQMSADQGLKRSSYKTQDEIYSLRGDNVFVTDYSGRVLRTEKLDPEIHKGFFE